MKLKRQGLATGLVLSLLPALGMMHTASAAPVPGGSLDPLTIPKYVTPLVIPPVLYDDGGEEMDVEVSLRQITQQVLPDGFPATPLWAYGNPNDATTYNNPSFTFEITRDVVTKVKWTNDLVDEENNFLPHIIQDENGTPIIDQTLHWAAPNQDCLDGIPRTDCRGASSEPYTGPVPMVVHVHGAHVGPESDGYPEAWWLPAADNIPEGYATEGTFFASADDGTGEGDADFVYTNDQPSSTLWYHDHSLGMTRLNVYAAGAGFWLIREANDGESGLLSGVLPGPAPQAGQDPNGNVEVRKLIREIPIAIQPKSFNADGTQYYPADRAFFEGLGTGATFNDNTDLNIPFLPANSSDIAPAWNPEAFFNTMVVNGRTWPVLEVAPERYRLRFVNASDSRFMNLSLFTVDQNGNKLQELPFYQIGSDQGLLPEVVQIETGFATVVSFGDPLPTGDQRTPGTFAEQALLLGPAERPDVIVDFTGLPSGTIVRMFNTAPDAPFGGFPDIPADPATTGQVMQFVVNNDLMNPTGDPSSAPNELKLDKDPGGEARFKKADVVRDLALLEEESALLCVTVDAVTGRIDLDEGSVPPLCDPVLGSVPFAPKAAVLGVNGSMGGVPQLWDDPIAQNPQLGNVEQWELWNWSADAHPIHLHLVKFQVQERYAIGSDIMREREPWEAGWKDTVIAYPGEVTTIRAKFDIPGLYVWHCHILSHEDNEMMVPYCVGEPGQDCPAELFE